jgi:hypothetical protein
MVEEHETAEDYDTTKEHEMTEDRPPPAKKQRLPNSNWNFTNCSVNISF